MNIVKVGNVYKSVRISGPRHNYLGIAITSKKPDVIRIVVRGLENEGKRQIDEARLVASVSEGVSSMMQEYNRSIFIDTIEYVASDSPDYAFYAEASRAIFDAAVMDCE